MEERKDASTRKAKEEARRILEKAKREADMIIAAGGHSVTMGSRILRTETAGPTALAVLMYEFGEWEAAE